MRGWHTKELKQICVIEKVQGMHRDLPYVGLEDIEAHTGRFSGQKKPTTVKSTTFKFTPDHLLYGRLRPYLNKVMAPEFTGHCSTEIFPLRPLPGLSRDFLKYWFLKDETVAMINVTSTGARMPRANMKTVLSFPFQYPPLPEQQRIVAILDEAFENINRAKENAEKNLQNARELFEGYLQSVFTRRGEGWKENKLGDICKFIRGPFGGSLKKSLFVPDGYAIYEQKHAIHNHFNGLRYFIDESKFKEMKRFELLPGDLIMSCSGTMGRVAIAPAGIKQGIINQALLKLTPTEKVFNKFLKYWMESNAFQDALAIYSGGAAIKNVSSVKVLKDIKIPLPPKHEQEIMVQNIDAALSETKNLETIYTKKIAVLDELKKSLLDQAFTGKL